MKLCTNLFIFMRKKNCFAYYILIYIGLVTGSVLREAIGNHNSIYLSSIIIQSCTHGFET